MYFILEDYLHVSIIISSKTFNYDWKYDIVDLVKIF